MTLELKTSQPHDFAEMLENFRSDMHLDDAAKESTFYLIQPNELYVSDTLDSETTIELDKVVSLYEGNHDILTKH